MAAGNEDMTGKAVDGIVTHGHGNRFTVYADGRYYSCQVRKKIKFKTDQTTPVAVGDDVRISIIDDREGVVEEVRPRRSVLSRPVVDRETTEHVLAANIDALIIVVSTKEPQFKPGVIDRFLIAAHLGGLHPAIVVNKIDLGLDPETREAIDVYRQLGHDLFLTSALDGFGLEELRGLLRTHRSILAGHSGVGKSTLLNRLLPGTDQPTREVSVVTGRGKHTTSSIQMFHLADGGYVIDSPGVKVLGLWQVDKAGLASCFPEMLTYMERCRFPRCRHLQEPDCAVKEAVEKGDISRLRYNSYCQIYSSLECENRTG